MKKITSLMLALVMSLALCVPAFAAENELPTDTMLNENDSSVVYNDGDTLGTDIITTLSQEEIEKIPGITLISTQIWNFIVDEEGNLINIIEGEMIQPYGSSSDWSELNCTATVKLYKSGSKYFVSLSVTAHKDWWVTKVELSNRAVGDSNWATIEKTYTSKPNSVTVTSYSVYFPDSPCNVEVKGYIAVEGPGVLDHSYYWQGKEVLDKP